jgi:outer membrane protein TolC
MMFGLVRWPVVAVASALVVVLALPARGAWAEVDAGSPTRTPSGGADLRRCLSLADRNHPNLLVARAKVAQVRAQLWEAYTAPFMAFKASGGVALAPTILGNQLYSPNTDASLTSSLGVAWRFGISGVVPLWTFGKITNLWDAAEANVKVNEAGVDVARDGVRLDVRKAYLGLQLSRDALHLLGKAMGELEDQVAKLEKEVEADEADLLDLLELQTFVAELHVRKAEAERFEQVAIAGLRFYAGVTNLKLADRPLAQSRHKLGHLARYLSAARLHRPEVKQAQAGIAAREAQLRLSRSRLFPDLGLGMNMGLSAAPEVADQINPYVSDGGNYFHYSAAIVFQWRLDFAPAIARIAFAEAQLQEVMALDRQALGGVAAEVEEAYATVVDWKKRLAAYRKAERYSRKWFVTVQQGIDIGTIDEDELLDPAKRYAEHRYNVLKATMEYNLAMSKLAKATGWDAIAPGG